MVMTLCVFLPLLLWLSHVPRPVAGCPPRPDIPQNIPPLSQLADLKVIEQLLAPGLAPCQEGAFDPSPTSISCSFVLGDRVEYINLGCVDKMTKLPTQSDTIFLTASVSKTFVMEQTIRAYRDGKISSLDDELNRYAPDFHVNNPFGPKNGRRVPQPTFREMLSHLSGLSREAPCDDVFCLNVDTPTILSRLRHANLVRAPEMSPSYSNLAFGLLGHLIANRLYNETFEHSLLGMVRGLSMKWTGVNLTKEVKERMAIEYQVDGSSPPLVYGGWTAPAGDVYSTSVDLALWLRYLLTQWRSDPLYRALMRPAYINGDFATGFGLPWEYQTSNGYFITAKSGLMAGVTSVIAMVPELDFGFSILWNGVGSKLSSLGITKAICDYVLPRIIASYEKLNRAEFPPLPSRFDPVRFSGRYIPTPQPNPGLIVSITLQVKDGIAHFLVDFYLQISLLLRPSKESDFVFQIVETFSSSDGDACTDNEFQAALGTWVYFNETDASFTMPGIFFASVFHKVSGN